MHKFRLEAGETNAFAFQEMSQGCWAREDAGIYIGGREKRNASKLGAGGRKRERRAMINGLKGLAASSAFPSSP